MTDIKLSHISAAPGYFNVWAVGQKDGVVFGMLGGGEEPPGWGADETAKAVVVAAVSRLELWCVNQAHQIWHGVYSNAQATWTQAPTASGQADAAAIAAASDGSVWYADTHDGTLYRRENNAWHKDPTGKAAIIAVGSKDHVWCANAEGSVFQRVNGEWKKDAAAANARTLSVAEDGAVWYGNAAGHLFRRNGSAWTQDPTAIATVVSVANKDQAFCLNQAGEVFYTTPTGWQKFEPSNLGGNWEYTLQSGETLAVIAATQYKTDDWAKVNSIVDAIARLNRLPDKNNVAAGLALTMPPLFDFQAAMPPPNG